MGQVVRSAYDANMYSVGKLKTTFAKPVRW
ncbi:hypothetical protein SPHINGO391_500091 [Sphingomonas aurantiaca]|jgi:hypothetical protein|uniref:Uncharacterized protein n=1 Tax=Sphingomonas aurantiaca TaxID=185949 RepID=A0A5E8A8X2_9SPHN|nr:hypothetical protein SPHINGO391_500091 [Sphingomonas aurantiaca]